MHINIGEEVQEMDNNMNNAEISNEELLDLGARQSQFDQNENKQQYINDLMNI